MVMVVMMMVMMMVMMWMKELKSALHSVEVKHLGCFCPIRGGGSAHHDCCC